MTVYELRALAEIIGRACRALPSRDADGLVSQIWLFLVTKRLDLTLALWQAMTGMAEAPPGDSHRPGGPGGPALPGDLTLQTADGPAVLRVHRSFPHASPPYVIVSYHAPDSGERFAAYERRATWWIRAGTMLTRPEATTWTPGSGEAAGEPVPEVAGWLDRLISAEPGQGESAAPSPASSGVTFHPGAGPEAPACLELAGVLVFTDTDTESGALVVSLDLDTATPDVVNSAGLVPVRITIQGTTVLDSSAG